MSSDVQVCCRDDDRGHNCRANTCSGSHTKPNKQAHLRHVSLNRGRPGAGDERLATLGEPHRPMLSRVRCITLFGVAVGAIFFLGIKDQHLKTGVALGAGQAGSVAHAAPTSGKRDACPTCSYRGFTHTLRYRVGLPWS